jgi:hypothetical protein
MATFKFVPPELEYAYADSTITRLLAAASRPEPCATPHGAMKTNHWVLYFELECSNYLRLDPNPSQPGLNLVMLVTHVIDTAGELSRDSDDEEEALKIANVVPSTEHDKLPPGSNGGDQGTLGQAVKIVSMDMNHMSFRAFLDLLSTQQLDRYQFTENRQGCRFWILTVVAMLKHEGCLKDPLMAMNDINALKRVWAVDGFLVPMVAQSPAVRGTFTATV